MQPCVFQGGGGLAAMLLPAADWGELRLNCWRQLFMLASMGEPASAVLTFLTTSMPLPLLSLRLRAHECACSRTHPNFCMACVCVLLLWGEVLVYRCVQDAVLL